MHLLIIYSEKCIYKIDYCEIHVSGITGLVSNHAYGWIKNVYNSVTATSWYSAMAGVTLNKINFFIWLQNIDKANVYTLSVLCENSKVFYKMEL